MKNKILITGMTSANVRGQMAKTGVYTQSHMYREGLKKLGYEVTNEPPNETALDSQVENHDMFLIGFAQIGSITAGWRMPLLSLLGRILESGKPVITFIDDWQFQSIMPGLVNINNNKEKIINIINRDIKMSRLNDDFLNNKKQLAYIITGLFALTEKRLPMLSSVIEFDPENTQKHYYELSNKPIFIDPSCYQPIPEIKSPIKYKAWVIAGLADYQKYTESLNLKWHCEHVGKRQEPTEEKRGRFVSEKESVVFEKLSQVHGMLIPNYKATNTDWWRPRYLFAKSFNNVIYAIPGSTGKHSIFNIHPNEIESMSPIGLRELKESQFEILDNIIWKEEQFLEKLKGAFDF